MSMKTKEEYKAIAASMKFDPKNLIDGKLVTAASGRTFDTCNPATGKKLAEVPACDESDVNRAVAAARKAFEDKRWAGMEPAERKRILFRFADIIEAHQEELAIMETLDSGKPIGDTLPGDLPGSIDTVRWYAEAVDKTSGSITTTPQSNIAMIVREPIGVVAAITPWNFPLSIAIGKIAPILAAGNSAIIKPASVTPLTTLKLGEYALEAGIPDGVLNIISGGGGAVGNALAMHPDVDLITFTGSTEVGKHLLECSGLSNTKRVHLELGGKSPTVVMPDISDLDYCAEQICVAALFNMGENCTANSRILIHEDIKDALLEKILEKAKAWTLGDPFEPAQLNGALIEKKHMEKVLEYIETGKKEGAKLVMGGRQILQETDGYFVEPAIFDGMTPDMTISKEEIFGPVFGITTFKDIDEAIRLANDTPYGLQACVWSDDLNIAHRLARSIYAGTVSVNCFSEGDITTPFGGFKESGFCGREKSMLAMAQYSELKTIWIQLRGHDRYI